MTNYKQLKLGITQTFECSYLNDETEQLLVVLDQGCYNEYAFEHLLEMGFRRSGSQIYRPHCPFCSACESIRVRRGQFLPSNSQKRVLKKCQDFTLHYSWYPKETYYQLYEKYINERHMDGSMYPPSRSQYENFLLCHWLDICFIEIRNNDQLIAVAVTDTMPDSLSAIYTFYDPSYEKWSIGTFCILKQIELLDLLDKSHLYLGYQIENCHKMRYKSNFLPHERLIRGEWQNFKKKP
ncbi:arginyltransferase [Algicola sagamiensis]|uniref:arginyltransferase n=1 Tax=Algicola sagamiensis TaxID=163869 RepID=UPI000370FB40|nr:arginyltransferase [Algicola sagamiensis]